MADLKAALQYASQNPTSEFAKSLGQRIASGQADQEAQQLGIDLAPIKQHFTQQQPVSTEQPIQEQQPTKEKVPLGAQIGEGIVKGAASTLQGLGELGTKIGAPIVSAISGVPKEQIGAPMFKEGTPEYEKTKEILKANTGAESVGKFGEQVAEFFIPAGQVAKVEKILASHTGTSLVEKLAPIVGDNAANLISKATSFGTKAAVRAGEGGGVVALQSGGDAGETKTAAALSAAIPVAGVVAEPIKNLTGRLLTNLAAGISGMSEKALQAIRENPEVASQVKDQIAKSGGESILQKNAETIVNGVSKIRKEARAAFGQALDALSKEDIQPKLFRDEVQKTLDKYGFYTEKGKKVLSNVEFDDPKNIKKAKELITKLNTVELDGKSLRKLSDDIESERYKIATSDERLAFNSFLNDLSSSLKDSISASTDKLDMANAAFSKDMQLAEGIQKIFGKVKFKNVEEINNVARKLESLFSQKGLDPKTVDDFLNRIGIKPGEFKASEATRQITEQGAKANTEGISVGELTRGVSSAAVTPKLIRDLMILTGKSQQQLAPFLEQLSPTARASFIELFSR